MKRKIASGSSVNAKSGATGLGTKIATKHALMKQKALEEDPTVFQVNFCIRFICKTSFTFFQDGFADLKCCQTFTIFVLQLEELSFRKRYSTRPFHTRGGCVIFC